MSTRSRKTDTTRTAGQGVPLGAPGSTGAFETHDPLGAPGSTGAYPTNPRGPTAVGYDTGSGNGGQEQLHRPTATATGTVGGTHVPLHKEHGVGNTGATNKNAYGTAATTESAGHHASVQVPHQTTDTTGVFGSGYDKSDIGRTGGTKGEQTHGVSGAHAGYDTGSFGATGGHGGGGGYDTGSFETTDLGHTGMTTGQREGHGGGGGGGYDTGSFGTTEFGHTGVTTGDKELHRTVGGHGGGGYDIGGDKTHGVGHGVAGRGGTGVVHTEERVYVRQGDTDEDKGIMERIKDHLPGSGGSSTK